MKTATRGKDMKLEFESYLIYQGYKQRTLTGRPSTVYDYTKRIDKICEWEGLSWEALATNISQVLAEYNEGGVKQHLGEKSHRAVINALKRFKEFLSLALY